ncbi:hypothetical protein [Acinetobacter thermotolerans]|uniref:hypothetical protein n=2 Tax=Acinetobacter thermotolerans TaxID=3151487 RepID=UPI00325AB7ED
MSHFYYQTNLFQPKIFINQLNININIHTDIYSKVEDINFCFQNFKDSCEFQEENEIKDKALTVLSRYRNIIKNKKEFLKALNFSSNNFNKSLTEFDKLDLSIIETGLILLDEFVSKSQLFDKNKKIVDGLYNDIKNFYFSTIGTYLDNNFWYNLQFFEFLLENKILSHYSRQDYQFNFKKNELEDFFAENRSKILGDLLRSEDIYSPLQDRRFVIYYDIHKRIMSFTIPVLLN